MKRFSALLSTAVAMLLVGVSISARAETWVGPAPSNGSLGGVWNTAGNWSPASVPNAPGAVANFNDTNVTANRAYTFSADVTIGALNIVNNSTFTNIYSVVDQVSPSITFDSGGAGPATVTVTGTNPGTAQMAIVRGNVQLNSDLVVDNPASTNPVPSAGGTFGFQRGVVSGSGGITKNGTGVFTLADSGDKAYTGATIINNGRFRLNNMAKLTATSSITVNSGGQFDIEGAFDYTFGPGSITLNGFGLGATSPAGNFPGAIRTGSGLLQYIENNIVLASDSSINVVSTNPVTGKGILNLMNTVSGPGRLIANQKAGLISREGFLNLGKANTYTGGTTVEQGTLTIGVTFGAILSDAAANVGTGNVYLDGKSLAADGNPDGAASGKLAIESGITNGIADSAYLYMTGGGTAGLADRGYVTLGAGINETVGGLMVGGNGGVGGLILGPGTYGAPGSGATNAGLSNPEEYFAGTGIITVAPVGVPGDYNNNGSVDAGDYVLWKKGGPLSNDFTPGVQSTDYDFWRSRFGATTNPGSGSGLSSSAVPEPSTIVLFGCVASLLTLVRRRKIVLVSLSS